MHIFRKQYDCIQSFCDNGFYFDLFDETTNKCIEEICIKVQKEEKKLVFLILWIVFLVLFVIFGVLFLYCNCEKNKKCN